MVSVRIIASQQNIKINKEKVHAFSFSNKKKRAYPVQRAPALCGVWGRVLVASLTLACAM